jgi:poly(beta-D-mannuronate) lyase
MRIDRFRLSWLLLVLLPLFTGAAQRQIRVGTSTELRNALRMAKPGIRIVLIDGEYDLGGDVDIKTKGTAAKPISIAAQHRGKAKIIGNSRFILETAEHIVLEGMDFESSNSSAIELRACSHIRITRNTFHLKETQRGSWVVIDGIVGDSVRLSSHNRIDHNLFEKKSLLGNFITIEGTKRAQPQVSQYDRIDHNMFANIGPRVENVLEAIRVGSATYSLSSGFTVVEENLFERCDGDPEYISIKSSDDTIRHNTFRECLGSLSLRHGNRNTVEGNYILGNGRTGTFLDSTGKTWTLGTGGVRFYGTGMRIINNYFEGLTGKQWDATFAITSGNAEYGDGQPLTKHFRIHDATIAFNIVVDNASNLEIGYNGGGFQGNWWHLPPSELHIAWKKNIVWASGAAVVSRSPIDGVRLTDPRLVKTAGIWHLPNQTLHSRPLERKDVGPEAK